MVRNFILFVVVAVTAGSVGIGLDGSGGVAWGQSPTVAIGVMTGSVSWSGQPLVQDNFDDNKKANLWKTYIQDPNCWVTEINKRLEFGVKTKLSDVFAGYLGNGWWIDPLTDFSMRVDLSYDLSTYDGGWIGFGLTPNPQAPRDQYMAVGIGCATYYPTYWHEWRDDYDMSWDFTSRFQNRVTLYISYDAFHDELYVGDSGYGSDEAWQSFPNVIAGRWGSAPLFVFLGETADGAIIESGHAFVDNFVIESGRCVKAEPPSDPNNPTDPNGTPGDETEPNVPASVVVLPSVLSRGHASDSIMVVAALPKGIRPLDVDDKQPWVLLPGGAQATQQNAFVWLTGQTMVTASFDGTKLMAAVPNNGKVELRFAGRLKDGRSFGGTCVVTIK